MAEDTQEATSEAAATDTVDTPELDALLQESGFDTSAGAEPEEEASEPISEPGDQPAGDEESGADEGTATDDEPAEPTWTSRELNAVQQTGFSEADLDTMGDNARTFVDKAVKMNRDFGRRYAKLGQRMREVGERPAEDAATGEDDAAKPLFDPQEYEGDEYATHLNTMNDRVRELEGVIAGLTQNQSEEADARAMWEADTWLGELDPKVYGDLGEGATLELDPDSPEADARERLFKKADQLALGYYQMEGEEPPLEECLQEALGLLYPDARTSAKQAKRNDAKARRRGQRLAPPTSRKTVENLNTPEEQAAAAIGDWEKETGHQWK